MVRATGKRMDGIFTCCIRAADILDIDRSFRDSLQTAREKLPPIRLRADGAIREWFENFEQAHPNHRHTSHLLALSPFSQITPPGGRSPQDD